MRPFIIENGILRANLIQGPWGYLPFRYRKENGDLRSYMSSFMIDLRFQFGSNCYFCGVLFIVEENNYEIRGKGDFVFEQQMAHRHGFPSDIGGPGRGMWKRALDIAKHPLSYILVCETDHEGYDTFNGEWRRKRNRKNDSVDSVNSDLREALNREWDRRQNA